MGDLIDTRWLEQIWHVSWHWIRVNVLVLDNLTQLAVVGAAFFVAKLAAAPLRKRHRQWLERRGGPLLPGTLRNAANVLILPAVWLVVLWICMGVADYFHLARSILRIAASLLTAWVVIRSTATLVRHPFLTRVIAATAWTLAALNILKLLKPTLNLLDHAVFHVGTVHLSVLAVLKGLLYLGGSLWLANLLATFIEDRLRRSPSLSPSMAVLTGKLVRIILITTALVLAVSSVGIDLTVFAVFGGALGVGLGFGLQKVVSNFISGIILLLDRSIKPGDVISIGNTYGWVKSLNARYVSLDTRDGIEHLIPNEDLIVNRVENWSYSNPQIRLKVPVGVHYQSDMHKVIQLCVEAAEEVDRILKHPKPVCEMVGFGESSVDFEIRAWIDDPQHGLTNVRNEVLLKVWDKFKEHGVEIPYPQRDVHIKTGLSPESKA